MTCELEEHVVKARAPQRNVFNLYRMVIQNLCRRDHLLRPTATRTDDPSCPGVEFNLTHAQGLKKRSGLGQSVTVYQHDFDALPADLRLEFVGGALRNNSAVVYYRDFVGEFIGFFELLRCQQQCRAVADETSNHIPHRQPAPGIQPSRRLVKEQDPWLTY